MSDRLVLKGKLQELITAKLELATAANANIKAAKSLLTLSDITPIDEIDIEAALVHIREARAQQKEYLYLLNAIKKIEAELE